MNKQIERVLNEVEDQLAERRLMKSKKLVDSSQGKFYSAKELSDKDIRAHRDEKMLARAESAVGKTDSRYGVEMISREVTSMAERPMYADNHDVSDATIRETAWDLARIVERPTLINSFAWTISSPSLLTSIAIPSAILPIKLAKMPFQSFQYWRGDVIMRLQVAGSPMMQGIVGMSFIPLVSQAELDNMVWDLSSLTINPTVFLYANTNTVSELRIPYNHPQSYIDTAFPASGDVPLSSNMGYVVIYVVEPLVTVGEVTQVTMSLFSILENSQFKVPRLSSAITAMARAESYSALSSVLGHGSMSSLVDDDVAQTVDSAKNRLVRSEGSGKGSLLEKITAKAMPNNFIGDMIDLTGEALHGVLGFMGLDNPTIPVENERTIVKANGSMNYSVGPEHIEKLSIVPSVLPLVTEETFATAADELDTGYLYRKYSYFGRFTISKNNAVGTTVFTVPLSPFPTINQTPSSTAGVVPIGTVVQDNVWFPLLSYLGLPYRYWTGGIRYKFIVSASSLHTCKLFCAFNYGNTSLVPSSLMDATSQYGAAIEISQGSNEFEITVPYVALTPYKEVCQGSMTPDTVMGNLNIVIMNQLIAPTSVSPNIGVACFIAGAEDFSYEMLGGYNSAVPVYRTTLSRKKHRLMENLASNPLFDISSENLFRIGAAESGIFDVQTTAPLNVAPTVTDIARDTEGQEQIAPPQIESTVDDHFGITSISLKSYLKRYQAVTQLNLTHLEGTMYVGASIDVAQLIGLAKLAIVPVAPPVVNVIPQGANAGLISWAGGMFRQFRGSLRFKIVITAHVEAMPTVTPVQYFVFWKPGNPPTLPGDEIIRNRIDLIANAPTAFSYNTYNSQGYCTHAISPKLTILNGSVSNVIEFEMPYSSKYNSVLTSNGFDYGSVMSMGKLYLYTVGSENVVMDATIFVAFGDESRFGTLYRVPLVYAPAVYDKTTWAPTANVDGNSWALKSATSGFVVARAESGVEGVTSELSALSVEPTKDGPVYGPMERPSPQNGNSARSMSAFLRNRIVRFLKHNSGCSAEDFNKYMDSLCITPAGREAMFRVFQKMNLGQIFINRGGKIYLRTHGFYGPRRNRERVRVTSGLKQRPRYGRPFSYWKNTEVKSSAPKVSAEPVPYG